MESFDEQTIGEINKWADMMVAQGVMPQLSGRLQKTALKVLTQPLLPDEPQTAGWLLDNLARLGHRLSGSDPKGPHTVRTYVSRARKLLLTFKSFVNNPTGFSMTSGSRKAKTSTSKTSTSKTSTSKTSTPKTSTPKTSTKVRSKKPRGTREEAENTGGPPTSSQKYNAVPTHQAAFEARSDLAKYAPNARLLFALEIRFGIDDIHSAAVNSLTDGPDDKKCDLIYVDREQKLAVIAQAHETKKTKASGSSNKASDLNTAIAWALGEDVDTLPEAIKDAARELREAISDRAVTRLYVWFVHGAVESVNVKTELRAVERNLKRLIREHHWSLETEVIEVGSQTLEEWYSALTSTIQVGDRFEVDVPGGYIIKDANGEWEAAMTSVPLAWIQEVFQQHKSRLFSANIRGYLGFRDTDENINNGIKNSALQEPANFWVFNNGLTALVHKFEFSDSQKKLFLDGLSVVNGAQTTGAIGNIAERMNSDAMVSIRFVRTTDKDIVHDIIRYNNSQNKVTASDFRSNDRVQRRLREQFRDLDPEVVYPGGRRGGETDAMARSKRDNLIPSDSAAQALAAFHQDPGLAYFHKGQIWEDNETYHRFFNDTTSANHVIFVFSLLRAVERAKSEIRAKAQRNEMTEIEDRAYRFFLGRGATYLLIAAIARCLETFAKRRVAEPFRVSFGTARYNNAVTLWKPIVDIGLAGCQMLQSAIDARLKEGAVKDALIRFQQLIEMTKQANSAIYTDFNRKVKID